MSGPHLQEFELSLELKILKIKVKKGGVLVRTGFEKSGARRLHTRINPSLVVDDPIKPFSSILSSTSTIRPIKPCTNSRHMKQMVLICPICKVIHHTSGWAERFIILMSP